MLGVLPGTAARRMLIARRTPCAALHGQTAVRTGFDGRAELPAHPRHGLLQPEGIRAGDPRSGAAAVLSPAPFGAGGQLVCVGIECDEVDQPASLDRKDSKPRIPS